MYHKIILLLMGVLVTQSVFAEIIDDMSCQKSDGFGMRMESQGFKRELTLPFGWSEYDNSLSHNISGSSVNSYEKKSKNQWALYTNATGQWRLFQGVIRKSLTDGSTKIFVCEVKSGTSLKRH